MSDNDKLPAERDANGRLLPGHSVRSPGMSHGASRAERVAVYVEPHIKDVLNKAIDLAKKGDPRSMELVLKYHAPIARPDAERVSIPGITEATTLQEKAEKVIEAAATGHCTAEAAAKLLQMLDIYRQAIAVTDLERRMQALEEGRKPRVIEAVPPDDFDPDSVA